MRIKKRRIKNRGKLSTLNTVAGVETLGRLIPFASPIKTDHNPTGLKKHIIIFAAKVPMFSAGKSLKDAVK